jgi:hypothetical protein
VLCTLGLRVPLALDSRIMAGAQVRGPGAKGAISGQLSLHLAAYRGSRAQDATENYHFRQLGGRTWAIPLKVAYCTRRQFAECPLVPMFCHRQC